MTNIPVSLKQARRSLNEYCPAFDRLPFGHPEVDPREVLSPGDEIILVTGAKLYRLNIESKRPRFIVGGYAADRRDTNKLGVRLW